LNKPCDAGRQARFISNNYPGEADDKKQLIKLYNDMTLSQGVLWASKTDGADGDDGRSTQVDLYRLQQLGVVQNYNLEFLQNGKIRFEVAIQPWDLHTLETNLSAFLRKMRSSGSAISTAMTRLRHTHQTRYLEHHQVPPVLEAAIDILLERIYAEIPTMRYVMLGNLLRYAINDHRNVCRRIEIRSTFDDEDLALGNYRCGFCDVCQPDLNFQVDMAEIPLRDAEIQHASRQLPQILEVFDVEQLPQLVQVAVGKGAVPGLYAKVSNALERDATNLSALYLAGALGIRQEQFIDLGFEQLGFCYQEAKRQGLHTAGIQLIYQEAKAVRPIEAFIWINEVNGPFDNQEGLLFLAQEATQLFGTTSHLTHNLHQLYHIRVLQQMQNKITHVSASLSALLEDFSSFPCLKGKN
jgi:ATP-dependent DNA helicase RecQ